MPERRTPADLRSPAYVASPADVGVPVQRLRQSRPSQSQPPRIQIESLRVRIPGGNAQEGHRFAAELRAQLAERSAELFGGALRGEVRVGAVQLSVRAGSTSAAANAVSAAIASAISRSVSSKSAR